MKKLSPQQREDRARAYREMAKCVVASIHTHVLMYVGSEAVAERCAASRRAQAR